jgi:DNA-binding transcriptional ArsR family regulator
MGQFVHPQLEDVSMDAVLHALGDPARLKIVRALAMGDGALCCEASLCSTEVPKSTRSNHLRILRNAGVIHTQRKGRELLNTLRRDELDHRFPGLMTAILAQD